MTVKNMNYYDSDYIPVMLGDDPALFGLLRRKYGDIVHIFSEKCRLSLRLSYFADFHRIKNVLPEILLMYLKSFASDFANGKIPVIISDKAHENALEAIKNQLETDFLVLEREDLS